MTTKIPNDRPRRLGRQIACATGAVALALGGLCSAPSIASISAGSAGSLTSAAASPASPASASAPSVAAATVGNAPLFWERSESTASTKATAAPHDAPACSAPPENPHRASARACPDRPASAPESGQRYSALIEVVASEFGLDAALLRAIVATESGYHASVVSAKGAVGLMQVLPSTAARFGFDDLRDPRTNLLAGATYLRWLLERFHGNVRLAVAAYNAGENAVERYGQAVPPYEETRHYVSTVMARYRAGLKTELALHTAGGNAARNDGGSEATAGNNVGSPTRGRRPASPATPTSPWRLLGELVSMLLS